MTKIKGLAIKYVVLIVIGIIVAALALSFLNVKKVYLCDPENPLPFCNDEKMRLIRYITCAFAKCGAGNFNEPQGCGRQDVRDIPLEFNEKGEVILKCGDLCSSNDRECGIENALNLKLKSDVVLSSNEPVNLQSWNKYSPPFRITSPASIIGIGERQLLLHVLLKKHSVIFENLTLLTL